MFKKLKDIDPGWKPLALAGCICVAFFVLISHLGTVLGWVGAVLQLFRPVLVGAIIAYIFYPLAALFDGKVFKKIKRPGLRWGISVTLTLIIVFSAMSVLLVSLIPALITGIQSLLDNIPQYTDGLLAYAKTLPKPIRQMAAPVINFATDASDPLEKLGTLITDNLTDIIAATSDIGGRAVNGGIGVIIAVYLLYSKQAVTGAFRRLLALLIPPESYGNTRLLVQKFNAIFSKYISCELLDALIVGGANFIFMLILKMPDALVVSVLVGVTNLAPTFGPIVGAVGGSFILLLVSPADVLPFLIFTVALQTVDGYILKPRLFGGALNVPGVLILIAIIVFGRLWGVGGILIAIPLAAILVYLYSQMLLPRLESRREALIQTKLTAADTEKETGEKKP